MKSYEQCYIKKLLCFLGCLFIVGLSVSAQNRTELEGRIYSKDGDLAGTHIVNQTTQRATITDVNGFFTIPVRLNDTLVFSAVQFKRKEIVVTDEVLNTRLLFVPLQDVLNELQEVVVMPYNLTGEIDRDLDKMKIGQIVTSSTLDLPNAHVVPITQSQRKLYTARTWDPKFGFGFKVKTDPLINYFSGRTKRLKKRIVRERRSKWIDEIRGYYSESLYIHELKIPKSSVGDFIYSCEKDSLFEAIAKNGDRLQLWEVLKEKSIKYLGDNDLNKK